MLLAYLPALIFEAVLEMMNEPARRAETQNQHDHPDGGQPITTEGGD